MTRSTIWAFGSWFAVLITATGCSSMDRVEPVRAAPVRHTDVVDLRPFFPRREIRLQSFIRTDRTRFGGTSDTYTVKTSSAGRIEGDLIGRSITPVARFLDQHSNRPQRPRFEWPQDSDRRGAGFFVTFDTPLIEWPLEIRTDSVYEQTSTMWAFGDDGLPFLKDTATRRISFDGFETTEAGGVEYPRCVKLRGETELRFGFWASVWIVEDVWLAPGQGVVRRNQRIHGVALVLFPFRSEHHFELAANESSQHGRSAARVRAPRWARLAIHLDRLMPDPQVAGLCVEWADRDSMTEGVDPR